MNLYRSVAQISFEFLNRLKLGSSFEHLFHLCISFIKHGDEHIDHDDVRCEHVGGHDERRDLVSFWAANFVFQIYISESVSTRRLRLFSY